jgi:hypothetical protein
MGAEQRRWTPLTVDIEDAARNLDITISRDLLQDEIHREEREQIIWANWIKATRMKRRGRRAGQIGNDVVPSRRHLVLREDVLVLANAVIHVMCSSTRLPEGVQPDAIAHTEASQALSGNP